jgi:hypothetical protein
MAYDCRVYRVLIASPSDVHEEREAAVRVIQQWNDLYSYSRKVALLPLRWETHTAPDYGTRPQEIINRAIVDECDLLVGIFWTRVGSPTGLADSGTLEEIERVGKAGKPIMLYFSKVGVDPESIDLDQIAKLKMFKEKTYPKGLVESYKSPLEFRDKFAQQLELKIRDVQGSDAAGKIPLLLRFLSIDKQEPIGSTAKRCIDHVRLANLPSVAPAQRAKLNEIVEETVRAKSSFPLPLVIENSSSSGVRNLYVELDLLVTSAAAELSALPFQGPRHSIWTKNLFLSHAFSYLPEGISFESDDISGKLAQFEPDTLQKTSLGWRLSFEWEALQPQRIRLIKPVLYVYSPESMER